MTARNLAQLSARIFGQVAAVPGMRSPTQYLDKPLLGPRLAAYYPDNYENHERMLRRLHHEGLYTDAEMEWRVLSRELNIRRGKKPARKGEGKRATKRK
eukprot:m.10412 g.10412  ORF g.10412 m.10412 type:complete len:99 (+) comp3078_c0_seq1:156-452(+)